MLAKEIEKMTDQKSFQSGLAKAHWANDFNVSEVSLYKSMAIFIAERLESGDIPDGVKVNETMVSKIFKVSRTPARQALEWLLSETLICELPTRGFVTGPTPTVRMGKLIDYSNSFKDVGHVELLATDATTLFDDIESDIMRLSVLGAWRLSVRALQDKYMFSKKHIEYSLKKLEFNGLLTHRKGGQWIINQLDEKRLEGLYDIRSWLEPNLLQNATVHIPMDVIEHSLTMHKNALANLSVVTSAELNTLELCLHRNMIEYADNPAGMAALASVNAGLVLSKHILASSEIPVGSEDPFIEEHIAVLDAIKRRRSEESKLRLQAHLLKSREKVKNRLMQFRKSASPNIVDFATQIED